jgi:hypothetical protein
MGGPENFCTHYRINAEEFYKLFPEMADKNGVGHIQRSEVIHTGPVYYQPQPVQYNPTHPQA